MTPDPMRDVLQVLHGELGSIPKNLSNLFLDMLLTAMETTPDLQNRTCQVLEKWWCLELPRRDELVPNCLLYLVARTLTEGAKVSVGTQVLARSLGTKVSK